MADLGCNNLCCSQPAIRRVRSVSAWLRDRPPARRYGRASRSPCGQGENSSRSDDAGRLAARAGLTDAAVRPVSAAHHAAALAARHAAVPAAQRDAARPAAAEPAPSAALAPVPEQDAVLVRLAAAVPGGERVQLAAAAHA